ncbi:MAG: hypothetical protein KJ621_17535 [Proteobacteria bacterium]|nr:hypothetical protein [Pseudomonadota bacterium]
MPRYNLKDIEPFLGPGYRIDGPVDNLFFSNVRPIHQADSESLVWVKPGWADAQVAAEQTAARVVICDDSIRRTPALGDKCLLRVAGPRLAFVRIVAALFAPGREWGRHPSAAIHSEAEVHPETWIGPGVVVGRARIGRGSVLEANCVIHDQTDIGEGVTIGAGAVIGADGFGYEQNASGRWEKFPHLGGVVVHDAVDIGALTCIVRGTLGNTEVGSRTKIDAHVLVGHNAQIEEDVMITAGSVIGGSSRIAKGSWISPGAVVLNKRIIGDEASVGPGTVVTEDLAPGAKLVARPGVTISAQRRKQLR